MKGARWSTAGVVAVVLYAHFGVAAAFAQERDLLSAPVDHWLIVKDQANGGDAPRLTRGEAGLTILTGAASILYQRDASLTGDFTIRIELQLFDPSRRNEGFGILFGGVSLMSVERQRYTYFLIRQDGSSLVKTRTGRSTNVVRDWQRNTSLRSWESRNPDADVVENTLMVEVKGDSVRFFINDREVWHVPRSDLHTDGVVGLRVNHGLRVRVAEMVAWR